MTSTVYLGLKLVLKATKGEDHEQRKIGKRKINLKENTTAEKSSTPMKAVNFLDSGVARWGHVRGGGGEGANIVLIWGKERKGEKSIGQTGP